MISIITSLYNSDRHLDNYVKALKDFSKNLKAKNDFEILVIANDPSPKEKSLREIFSDSSWFSFSTVKRESLYASWNRGIEMAKNEIVGFWNVDDVRYPKAIVDGIRLIKEGAELVYFPFIIKWHINFLGFSFVVHKRIIHPPKFNREEFTRFMHCGPFFIFTKSFYRKVGPFDEQFKIAGDFDWCIRAAKISEFKLSGEIAGEFSVSREALSSRKNPLGEAENNIIYKRYNIRNIVKSKLSIMMRIRSFIKKIFYWYFYK